MLWPRLAASPRPAAGPKQWPPSAKGPHARCGRGRPAQMPVPRAQPRKTRRSEHRGKKQQQRNKHVKIPAVFNADGVGSGTNHRRASTLTRDALVKKSKRQHGLVRETDTIFSQVGGAAALLSPRTAFTRCLRRQSSIEDYYYRGYSFQTRSAESLTKSTKSGVGTPSLGY